MMFELLKDDATLSFGKENEFKAFMSELDATTNWKQDVLGYLSLYSEVSFLSVKPEGTGIILHSAQKDNSVRLCAIPSIQARGEISGNGLSVLYESDKEKFAETINMFWRLFAKKEVKILRQGDKVSAIHSNVYAPISQAAVFNGCSDRLNRVFNETSFDNAYWDWNLTTACYNIKDRIIDSAYSKILGVSSAVNAQVRITTSDTSLSAVNIMPCLMVDKVAVPLGCNNISVVHKGKSTADTVLNRLPEMFNCFNAAFKNMEALQSVKINNLKNCVIKSCTAIKLPQKVASEVADNLENVSCNALTVYLELCKIADKVDGNKQYKLQTQEKISKALSWRVNTWKNHDVSGVVAWNAKDM